MFARIALFALLVGGLVACDQINPEIQFDMDENYSYITVGINEADSNFLFARVLADSPISEPNIDLLDGAVAISGVYTDPTLGSVAGSITASIDVVDGELIVDVTDISLPNVTITESALEQLNEEIAEGIRGEMQNRGEKEGELTEIDITADELSFTIRTPR